MLMTSIEIQKPTHITIHTDGACRGNPGPGGVGVVIQLWHNEARGHRYPLSYGVEDTTNNQMELSAAIHGLQFVENLDGCNHETPITIFSDSQYVTNGINLWLSDWKKRGWRKSNKEPVRNIDLWKTLDCLSASFSNLTYEWVRGHNGDPDNEEADALATAATPLT